MNYSLYGGFRFKTAGFENPTFFSEPYNKEYYPLFFEKYGFQTVRKWHSRKIDLNKEEVMNFLKRKYEKGITRKKYTLENGYKIIFNNRYSFNTHIEQVYEVMTKSFASHYGSYRISFEEFMFISGDLKSIVEDGQVILIYRNDELQGLLINSYDYKIAIKSMNGRTNLISKLKFLLNRKKDTLIHLYTGVLANNLKKGFGLGSVLFNITLEKDYFNSKIKTVIHPLMYEGNISNSYSVNIGENIGTYAVYEYDI